MLNDNAVPQYNQDMRQKHKLELELNMCKEIVNNLHSKKYRAAQVSTANERNVFLDKQLQGLQIYMCLMPFGQTNRLQCMTDFNIVPTLTSTYDAKDIFHKKNFDLVAK
jgi:hypothetical protein